MEDYPPAIATRIERAYSMYDPFVWVDENDFIDLDRMVQINSHNTTIQHPVKRCVHQNTENEANYQCQVSSVQLENPRRSNMNGSTSQDDVSFHRSQFSMAWLLKFTKGTLDVKFDTLFLVLIVGIQWEGHLAGADQNTIDDIIHALVKIKDESINKTERERIDDLSKCCVRQYTKGCFLFRVVNETLRADNRDKLDTLGPYCYLVFNYISYRTRDDRSLRRRLYELFQPTNMSYVYLYRGDYVTREIFEEYRQAVGQSEKYFRWTSFVSTSKDRLVAEIFVKNVLYEIQISSVTSADQFADLNGVAICVIEQEVLLTPNTRFRVKEVIPGSPCEPHVVKIEIVPSFIYIVQ
ncbi:unnamed protein product [Rotaria sp. Silwood2]|nr:unnamed protein product [Rotaria sp. Silwood2]